LVFGGNGAGGEVELVAGGGVVVVGG